MSKEKTITRNEAIQLKKESVMDKKKTMSRDEAIRFMRENPKVKITHPLFGPDEYLFGRGTNIYDECGYLFENWISTVNCGMRIRTGGSWETGWCLYKGGK